jgi:GNAT superfamily N-acetyltransferase
MTTAVATRTEIKIRPFTPEDYPAMVAVSNTLYPDYADTPAEWQRRDEKREAKIKWQRFVAEDASGKIIAIAAYDQAEDMYHPHKFHMEVGVLPEYQGQGIGKTLYHTVLEAIAPFDPLLVRAHGREDKERVLRFLADRNFKEEMREWESRLDIPAFDETPFSSARQRVANQGIVIKSLAELKETDPEWEHKFYEMDWQIVLDMPAPDVLTKPSFEHFRKNTIENPNFLPEAYFIALDGDTFVGESCLWNSEATEDLYVGATGVLREYRRRGIAMALKLHAIAQAKVMGTPQIKTWNAQSNRAMLSINEALGFVKQPAWISYALTLKEEEAA